ncbi:hypothetical protein LTR95_009549 [Oleoguttula sp. CCFEE 5521]
MNLFTASNLWLNCTEKYESYLDMIRYGQMFLELAATAADQERAVVMTKDVVRQADFIKAFAE